MIRLFLVRVLVSMVAIACVAVSVWQIVEDPFNGIVPFRIQQQGQEQVLRARTDVPLPAPLTDGEIIDLKQMSILERAAFMDQDNFTPDTPLTLVVHRDDKIERVTVAVPEKGPQAPLDRFKDWGYAAICVFLLTVCLLTLWRGRDTAAAWMCCLSVCFLLDLGAQAAMWSPLLGLLLHPMRTPILMGLLGAVYGTAASAARLGLPHTWRRVGVVVVTLLVVGCVEGLLRRLLPVYLGISVPQWTSWVDALVFIGVPGLSVLTLMAGYAHAPPEGRGRMQWILVSTAVLTVAMLAEFAFSQTRHPVLYAICDLGLFGLSILGYLYAILRTRIVDVTFVIDRALVYSVLTAMMLGLFSLLEDTIHRLALGDQLGWIVQAGGAVLVAVVLSPLHRLLDRGLERVFFHRLRAMAAALRALGKESAFYENEEALMARVLKQLGVPCAMAAIYERSGAVYLRRAADGDGWPAAVDADDPLFVYLRANRQMLDLTGRDSAAGAEGLAFPMAVGQILTGAVVCRLRAGEQLDSELRAAISELAHALGTSLYLLRYRELATLANEISSGKLDPEAARSRASMLAGAA